MSFNDTAKQYIKNQSRYLKGEMERSRRYFNELEEKYLCSLSNPKVIITPLCNEAKLNEISLAHHKWVEATIRYYSFMRNYPVIVGELILKGQLNV